jgi:hypothetical protein
MPVHFGRLNVQWERPIIAALFLVVLGLVLYGGWRLHRLVIAFVIAVAVTTSLWTAADAAIRTDYRDADGYSDCWPDCTLLQSGVAVVNRLAPVALLGLIVATAGLIALAKRHVDPTPPPSSGGS